MPAPTFVSAGAVDSASPWQPGMPSGWAINDILLLSVESADQVVNVPAGWAALGGSFVSAPGATTSATRLTVFWKRAVFGETSPSITGPADHAVTRMIAIRGCPTSGDPWDVFSTTTELTADTSALFSNLTTTVPNTLIVQILATAADIASTAHVTAFANSNLTGLTKRTDDWVTTGNGGGFATITGTYVGPGTIGQTTATVGTAAFKAMMTIAFKEPATMPFSEYRPQQLNVYRM